MAKPKKVLLVTLFASIFSVAVASSVIAPLSCRAKKVQSCKAYLYHISDGLTGDQIAAYYSVNRTQIVPIHHNTKTDYIVSVPCGCQDVNGTSAYFYATSYTVQEGDTFENATEKIYSGQAWKVGEGNLIAGQVIPIYIPCGCVEGDSQGVTTYTVQDHDTLPGIASLLSSTLEGMERLNMIVATNPSYIDIGWVLFVPLRENGTQM